MTKAGKTIFALGAYDRFNYGDILFPIVSKNFFSEYYPELNFECYALKTSDFSKYGGLPTKPISRLYKGSDLNEGDIVLFCGGGTLGSDWHSMNANLLGGFGNKFLYYAYRVLGENIINTISRLYFGAVSEFPWIAEPDDFPVKVKVIYNSVGGSELANVSEKRRALALRKLSNAAYLSFRDEETREICASEINMSQLNVSPDSAVLMSQQYPIDKLLLKVSKEVIDLTSEGNYVCFHANNSFIQKNSDKIIDQLEKIFYENNLKTIFLPIGRYVGLDDYMGLRELHNKIKTPCKLVGEDVSIWDIMFTIAKSSLFIGTSLHGNVTAQSFAVPHIGLSSRKSKLDFYLNTWDIAEQAVCSDLENLDQLATTVLNVPEIVRMKKRDQLINLATENFHNIAKVILS